jgi:hypothetical protein
MWGRSGGRCLQVARPSGRRKRSRSIAVESESSIVFFVYNATGDHPPLPAVGYLLNGRWLEGISPADHIFMDKEQEREWCTCVFDINGDGLAMVLLQMLTASHFPVAIVVHKDVPLGLYFPLLYSK